MNGGNVYQYMLENFGNSTYVLPRTYFSDIHPNPTIMYNSPVLVEFEITDEVEKDYEENYEFFKETEEKLRQAELEQKFDNHELGY